MLNAEGLQNLILYNHSNEPVIAEVAFDNKFAKFAYEVGSNREFQVATVNGRQRLKVSLNPYDGSWLVLLPGKIKSLHIDIAPFIPGDKMTIGITVNSEKSLAGVMPLNIEIQRSDDFVIKKNILARNGYGTVTIPTAPNEPSGKWLIKIVEPISGISQENNIEITPSSTQVIQSKDR